MLCNDVKRLNDSAFVSLANDRTFSEKPKANKQSARWRFIGGESLFMESNRDIANNLF